MPAGVRVHGNWYQKRPHRAAKWENICLVADGLAALRKELARRSAQTLLAATSSPIPITVGDLVAVTIRQKELEGLAPRTVASYRNLAEGPIHKAFGEIPWREMTRGMVISFQEAALLAGKTTTGNRAVAVLSIAFNYAIYKEWTETNPCSRVRKNPRTSDLASVEHAERAAKFRTGYLPKEEFMAVYDKLAPGFYPISTDG